jgi:predicted transposase/invertase (TIGR01784 family)
MVDLKNPLHRWLAYFDKNTPPKMIEEVVGMDEAIQKVQSVMTWIQSNPEMMRSYEQYAKAASDRTSEINGAKREARQEIANNLKSMGLSASQIAQATGLSVNDLH